jgi:hypothetical protein
MKMVPKILHFLFDESEFLSRELIVEWYENLPDDSPLFSSLKELIAWMQNDDDDEDNSD